ncbi:histidine kinase [Pelobium manganitolerans]|uniref:histidine kinase n=1 Tax=Pelobium manganitolerans TaxID=1842495 RepID=A0A419S470_9SPHI|nr:7TM diverse intracellular signaling domain-containing protein [Pelobium manganitolerans]RKD14418.1 histidine kinase [Pelobium manganitolerans]
MSNEILNLIFDKPGCKQININKVLKNVCILFFLGFACLKVSAQAPLEIKRALAEKYIGGSALIFQDSTAKLGFEEIRQLDAQFKPSQFAVPNLGISANNNWLKLKLQNNTNQEDFILNISNPIINEVEIFILKDGKVKSHRSTNYLPIRDRKYKHQFYLFDLNVKPQDSLTVYLKLNANEQILAPISIHTTEQTLPVLSSADAKTGIYLGIMAVMLLYNLFIYFTVRDKDYLVYCHYIFWVALTQATLLGFAHRFIWTDNFWLSTNMVIICGVMSGIATILFAKSFLRIQEYSKRLNRLLSFTVLMYVTALVLLLANYKQHAFQLVNLTAATVSLLIMFIAWYIYRKKYAPAKFFLISWSVFFASILVFVAKDYGLVPYNDFTVHAVEIGSALEAVLLSFALANKINIFKKEKELSQAQALAVAHENERIIREQNVILEQKVQERTHELSETNQELSNTLDHLKETQSQLVASEKMASLGQLTAGIAHEINNPINFVTSNVSPLKRDVNQLLEALKYIENVGLSEKPVTEKQQAIEDYKEELDFDYLKIEIGHLLSGIYDGASRTAEIVKGLRLFSRLDEDDLKKADINEGLDSTLVIMNSALNSNKIEVVKSYGELPLAECYPGKLNQVFLNIISNAIHAVQKVHGESGEGKLGISTYSEGENIFISIKDNGTGMNETTQSKIFDPFYTTKDVGEGTGLGMSIAFNTIKKHSGEIIVHSKVGEGTEMLIRIPIVHQISTS